MARITVIGIGPGPISLLTKEAEQNYFVPTKSSSEWGCTRSTNGFATLASRCSVSICSTRRDGPTLEIYLRIHGLCLAQGSFHEVRRFTRFLGVPLSLRRQRI